MKIKTTKASGSRKSQNMFDGMLFNSNFRAAQNVQRKEITRKTVRTTCRYVFAKIGFGTAENWLSEVSFKNCVDLLRQSGSEVVCFFRFLADI